MVINLVSAGHGEAMLRTAADFPPDVDEAAAVGLDLLPSARVAPPRIATAPVSLECRSLHILELGPVQTIVIGEVLAAHVDPAAVIDAERAHVDTVALGLIGRMQGPGWYVRCENLFQLS
jgi:flavin reductase (DIM6/NTAB) family NADH-FMN oxidoreductase RutF